MAKLIEGVYAAVLTPRGADGKIVFTQLCSWLEFLMSKGIRGFAINGATGEFTSVTESEFDQIMAVVAGCIKGRASFVVGVGAATSGAAIRLGMLAGQAGASALLLPMPYFFPYQQHDLESFVHEVADSVETPVLLYNLPQFTSGLQPETSLRLIQSCENVIGIKDSSGSLDTVRLLKGEAPDACRIIGNDGALAQALREGLADGVVSGVSCVLPELISAIFETGKVDAKDEAFPSLLSKLQSFIQQLDKMPTPWGLKVFGEARNLAPMSFPFSLSAERIQQAQEMKAWFTANASGMMAG